MTMREVFMGFFAGWAFGAALQWATFHFNGMLRTREEWQRAKQLRDGQKGGR